MHVFNVNKKIIPVAFFLLLALFVFMYLKDRKNFEVLERGSSYIIIKSNSTVVSIPLLDYFKEIKNRRYIDIEYNFLWEREEKADSEHYKYENEIITLGKRTDSNKENSYNVFMNIVLNYSDKLYTSADFSQFKSVQKRFLGILNTIDTAPNKYDALNKYDVTHKIIEFEGRGHGSVVYEDDNLIYVLRLQRMGKYILAEANIDVCIRGVVISVSFAQKAFSMSDIESLMEDAKNYIHLLGEN